jgi:hypothetical protein
MSHSKRLFYKNMKSIAATTLPPFHAARKRCDNPSFLNAAPKINPLGTTAACQPEQSESVTAIKCAFEY